MEFFDTKEEVLDVELTQYGKKLLSLGKLKPQLYAFFDDDIIYDSDYSAGNYDGNSHGEYQSDIVPRIMTTPRIKSQHNLFGIDSKGGVNLNKDVLYSPLGNMSMFATTMPAWELTFYEGNITGSVTYEPIGPIIKHNNQSIVINSTEKIPQIPVEIRHDFHFFTGEFLGQNIKSITVAVDEPNGLYEKENFEIEVFEVLNDGKELFKLEFKNNFDPFEWIYDDEDGEPGVDNILNHDYNTQNVGYYFDVIVDEQISSVYLPVGSKGIINPLSSTGLYDPIDEEVCD